MTHMVAEVVCAVDVDNTLLDNDTLLAALNGALIRALGTQVAQRFWEHYELTRRELGVATPLAATDRLGLELGDDVRTRATAILSALDPATFLYPRALEVVRHLRSFGPVVILSDGHPAYQERKIELAGLAQEVDAVYVSDRKEERAAAIVTRWPARTQVFVDDKATVLAGIARRIPDAFLIHVRQGKYGASGTTAASSLTVAAIGDLETLMPKAVRSPRTVPVRAS